MVVNPPGAVTINRMTSMGEVSKIKPRTIFQADVKQCWVDWRSRTKNGAFLGTAGGPGETPHMAYGHNKVPPYLAS